MPGGQILCRFQYGSPGEPEMVTFIQRSEGGEGRSHEKYLGEELSRQREEQEYSWVFETLQRLLWLQ